MNFNIIGAGTWGITFANLIILNGHKVKVLHRNSSKAKSLIKNSMHPDLPRSFISNEIQYTDKFRDLNSDDITLIAIPSNSILDFISVNNLEDFKLVLLSKGLDNKTQLLISELLINTFNYKESNIAVLSGPNHAEEIINERPTASTVASKNKKYRDDLRDYFSNDSFRLYTSNDIIGVQIGGAVKNVIAIASGICHGLKLGDNAHASLVTRGLYEIMQLSKIFKFKNNTIYGLSGLGDLVCTCYSPFSRNRRFGELLSSGKNVEDSKKIIGMISEGINTSRILHDIIKDNNLDMPICKEIYNIIYLNHEPKKSMMNLMNRPLKDEK